MATVDTPVPQVWPRRVAQRRDRRRFALCAVAVLSSLVSVDAAVHAVAMSQVAREFEMGSGAAGSASWIGSSVTVALLLGSGVLGDRIGRRPLLLTGGAGVVIGCLISTFAADEWVFLGGRVITGMATAAVAVTALSVLPGLFFASELPAVVGMWLAVQSAAVLAGGLGGGVLVTVIGWRTGYLLTAGSGLTMLVVAWLVVPAAEPARDRRADILGALLAGSVPAVLFIGIGRATEIGWRSGVVAGSVAAAAVLAMVFVWWERRRPDPALPMRLMRSTPFAAACVAGIASEVAAAVYLLPIVALLSSPAEPALTALVLAVPMFLGMIIGAVLSGSARQQLVPLRALLVSGLLCCACGALLGACVDVRDESWLYATAGTVVGFGVMWARAPQTSVIIAAVSPEHAGSAAAVQATALRIGLVLGPAALAPIVVMFGGSAAAGFFHGFAAALRVTALVLAAAAAAIGVLMYNHRARTTAEVATYCRYRAQQGRRARRGAAALRYAT